MSDRRSRRQKLQAMADDPGASQGERDNARSLLARMDPGTDYEPPEGAEAGRAGRVVDWSSFFTDVSWDEGAAFVGSHRSGRFQAASAEMRDYVKRRRVEVQRQMSMMSEEELRELFGEMFGGNDGSQE